MKKFARVLGLAFAVTVAFYAKPLQADEGTEGPCAAPCSTQQGECAYVGGTTPIMCYQTFMICVCMLCRIGCEQ